jgi:hypothetical protein
VADAPDRPLISFEAATRRDSGCGLDDRRDMRGEDGAAKNRPLDLILRSPLHAGVSMDELASAFAEVIDSSMRRSCALRPILRDAAKTPLLRMRLRQRPTRRSCDEAADSAAKKSFT